MHFTVERYRTDQLETWNAFVCSSNEGTLFHRLDFLAYHGERFREAEHHLVIYKGESIHGVMPMAVFEEDEELAAKSPYGGSYGGPVFSKPQNYQDSHEIIVGILEYLVSQQVSKLTLSLPISVYYQQYSETFRLALIEEGFQCVNRDISSAVCLDTDNPVSEKMTSRARNMARKARKMGVEVVRRAPITDFWRVMEKTFAKHGTNPTHTLAELQWLHAHLPKRIYVDVAYLEGAPVAGVGYFVINDRVNSSFYLCQDPQKQRTQALSLLIYEALEQALQEGFCWFDFGTSSVNMKGRPNIFRFKESFGAIGVFRETYEWDKPTR